MSIRTIVEINHDHLRSAGLTLQALVSELHGTLITEALNKIQGPVDIGPGVRVLCQRHHSEDTFLEVGIRGKQQVG